MLVPKLSKFISLSKVLLLGAGATLALSNNATATEIIALQYKESSTSVTINDLSSFARTGIIPQSIQNFFDTTDSIPNEISSILAKELKFSPQFVNSLIESSLGDFILGGLDEVINNSPSRRDLDNIRSTFVAAYEDNNRISLIELIERYPQRELEIDITNLEGTYNKISGIVEDVLPALEVAKAYVQDLVCDCGEPTAQISEDGTTTLVASNSATCKNPTTLVNQPAKSQEEILAEIMARNSTTLAINH